MAKTKKHPNKQLGIFNNPSVSLYITIVATAALLLIAWLLLFKDATRIGVNPNEVRSRINSVLSSTDVRGKQLASKTIDLGCHSGGVGLQTKVDCSIEGYKYFELAEDKKTALQRMNTKIESLGFKNSTYNQEVDNQILAGEKEGDMDYKQNYTTVRIGWSTLPSSNPLGPGSTAISGALSSHRIDPPKSETTVIGLVAHEVYWQCSSAGWDIGGLACIFPPHEPDIWSEK